MAEELIDWEAAYRNEGPFEGPPPWIIGEPQPEFTALIDAGQVRGEVLDVGCGYAELALVLAARGHRVVGVDIARTAISAAARAAEERGLATATFLHADICSLTGFDDRFDTIMDSTLFHSLPVDERDGYLRSVQRAAAPGASYFVLVFAKGAFPPDSTMTPNEVTEDELRAEVEKYWQIDEIRPVFILANYLPFRPDDADEPAPPPDFEQDDEGRIKLPGLLLSARKASL